MAIWSCPRGCVSSVCAVACGEVVVVVVVQEFQSPGAVACVQPPPSLRPCLGKQACWLAGEGAPELPCSAASAAHDSRVLSYSGLFQAGRQPRPHLTHNRIFCTTCTLSRKLPFTTGSQKHRPRHIRRCRGANDQSECRQIRLKVRQRAGRAQRAAEHTASEQKEQQ